jgi:hypothetical protein
MQTERRLLLLFLTFCFFAVASSSAQAYVFNASVVPDGALGY